MSIAPAGVTTSTAASAQPDRFNFHALRVARLDRDTDDAVVISFAVPESLRPLFSFEPGQYLTLRALLQGEEVRRSYSICSGQGEPLRVGVRRIAQGQMSSWLHSQVEEGILLEVMPPQGRFGAALLPWLGARSSDQPLAAAPHLLMIAAGSGITPILSLIRTALTYLPQARVTLLYGNRQVSSTLFREELEDLKNRYLSRLTLHTVFSRETVEAPADSPLAAGRLDADRLQLFMRTVIDPRSIHEVFVCGPHELNTQAPVALAAVGIDPGHIHVERFGAPPTAQAAPVAASRCGDATQARVALIRDGITREFDFQASDDSVLDAAARVGLDVPYSCKSGVCATCRCKLLEGEVRMERNFALEPAEVQAGFILSCQARPLSPRVVVSFDER